jgi:hypothetical protein
LTDIEMTKLCAEAMGMQPLESDSLGNASVFIVMNGRDQVRSDPYSPLHDDAQAMALVKRFTLLLQPIGRDGRYMVCLYPGAIGVFCAEGPLNHAIIECVASMQAAKCST